MPRTIKKDNSFFININMVTSLFNIRAILSTLITIRSIEKSNSLFRSLKLKLKFAEILFNLN